jgi:hypothetical protein
MIPNPQTCACTVSCHDFSTTCVHPPFHLLERSDDLQSDLLCGSILQGGARIPQCATGEQEQGTRHHVKGATAVALRRSKALNLSWDVQSLQLFYRAVIKHNPREWFRFVFNLGEVLQTV